MNEKISILVVSCDKYSDIWSIFFKTFRYYWPDCPYALHLGTNNLNLNDDGVKIIRIGEDVSYSDNLLKMIENISTEYFILWVDDLMLTEPVNDKRIKDIINYSIEKKLDFVKLLPNFPYAYVEEEHGIGKLPNGIKYQVSVGISLVRKSFMKEILIKDKSAWEIEYETSTKIKNNNEYQIYGISSNSLDYPLKYINILGKGKVIRNSKNYLIKQGGQKILEIRGLQSFKDYIYYRLFIVFTIILKKLKLNWKI